MNVRFEAADLMFRGFEPKTRVMTHVSRPLIAVLLGAVVFFAVWTVALKPHSSTSGGGSSSGVGSYQSAIDKAHQSVTTSDKASVAHGGTLSPSATTSTAAATTATPTAPATTTAPATATAPATTTHAASAAATKQGTTATATTSVAPTTTAPVSATQRRLSTTESALDTGKVVALLFYNPAGADDRAVRQELAAVPTNGNKVVKLAVPLSEAGRYTFITANVQLDSSPTLVLIDRAKQATTIVGFTDRYEIAQRVADTLAAPAK
jgi:hypothetical protein